MRSVIVLITILYSAIAFSSNNVLVLIPGAASSADQIYLKGLALIFGNLESGKYFNHLNKKLKAQGFNTIICPLKKDNDERTLDARAQDCIIYLLSLKLKNPHLKFHLIGHSMGGLVARKITSSFAGSRLIESITTISTPHRGSKLANFVLNSLKEDSSYAKFIRLIEFTPKKRKYLVQLKKVNGTNIFSEGLKNPRNIPIYSISNHKTNYYNAPLSVSQRFINEKNDGIIETSSMIYGRHLGTIEADHMESACILYTHKSTGCSTLKRILIKHLREVLGI